MWALLVKIFCLDSYQFCLGMYTYDLAIYANCHCIPVFLAVNSPFYRCMLSVVRLDQFERPGTKG